MKAPKSPISTLRHIGYHFTACCILTHVSTASHEPTAPERKRYAIIAKYDKKQRDITEMIHKNFFRTFSAIKTEEGYTQINYRHISADYMPIAKEEMFHSPEECIVPICTPKDILTLGFKMLVIHKGKKREMTCRNIEDLSHKHGAPNRVANGVANHPSMIIQCESCDRFLYPDEYFFSYDY
ncbi:MAG: hypothetical protein AAF380_02980, partial [Bacteroidota bacterium]